MATVLEDSTMSGIFFPGLKNLKMMLENQSQDALKIESHVRFHGRVQGCITSVL